MLGTVCAGSIWKWLWQIIFFMMLISHFWHQHMLIYTGQRGCVHRQTQTRVTKRRLDEQIKCVFLCQLKEETANSFSSQLFLKALFDYDPSEDPAAPCKDAAVAFKRGDILQIVSMEDNTWWQACHLGEGSTGTGLIPSKHLHERWLISLVWSLRNILHKLCFSLVLFCLSIHRRVALQRPKALFKPRRVKLPGDEQTHKTSPPERNKSF